MSPTQVGGWLGGKNNNCYHYYTTVRCHYYRCCYISVRLLDWENPAATDCNSPPPAGHPAISTPFALSLSLCLVSFPKVHEGYKPTAFSPLRPPGCLARCCSKREEELEVNCCLVFLFLFYLLSLSICSCLCTIHPSVLRAALPTTG